MSPKLISADSKSMHAPTCLEARVHTHRQTVRTHMSAFTMDKKRVFFANTRSYVGDAQERCAYCTMEAHV